MTNSQVELESNGFVVLDAVLSTPALGRLLSTVQSLEPAGKAGTRNLLVNDWCASLARELREHPDLAPLLPLNAVAVECIYFDKAVSKNWSVALHRDQFIPVKSRLNAPAWSAWSIKDGVTFVRPPPSLLQSLVSVRLHLDNSAATSGPLEVVPKSHVEEPVNRAKIAIHVGQGGILVFKPLLLHASRKLVKGRRRVLHFLYGPPQLPDGMDWAHAI